MDESTLTAQLKAAAWGLVSIVGVGKAVRILHQIAAELEKSQWSGPGDR